MSLPKGKSSGRGTAFLAKPTPRIERPPVAGRSGLGDAKRVPGAAPLEEQPRRQRTPIARISKRRLAELGEEPQSTFRPPSKPSLKQATKRRKSGTTRHTRVIAEWERELQEAWIVAVIERAEGRDEATGEPLTNPKGHHVIEQSTLWAYRRQMGLTVDELVRLLWDAANGMAINDDTHKRHDDGTPWTIPASALRDHHWMFAERCNALLGTQFFTERLRRDYGSGR